MRPPLPGRFSLIRDADTSVLSGGRLLLGGSPLRLTTLSELGAAVTAAMLGGGRVVAEAGPGAGALARRLVDAGLAHPVPPPAGDPAASAGASSHEVTVVIPVKDRARELAVLLAAVEGCCAEVIVVDDGSTDRSAAVAAAAGVRVLSSAVPLGPAAARMAGARAASTDFVAFCDSDVRPEPGWLDRLLPHLADPEVAAVAPRVASAPPGRPRGSEQWAGEQRASGQHVTDQHVTDQWRSRPGNEPALGHRSGTVSRLLVVARSVRVASDRLRVRYEVARSPLDLGPRGGPVRAGSRLSYVPAATLLIRRELADFDASMRYGEDVDLIWRLTSAGATVRYEPSSVVTHQPRSTWRGLLRQRFGYGSSSAPLAARHPGPLRPVRGAAAALATALAIAAWAGGRPGSRRLPLPSQAPAAAAGASVAVTVIWAAVTVRRLERAVAVAADPRRLATALTARGRRHVLEAAADTVRRTWLPLLLCAGRPGRQVLCAALVVPAALDWWRTRPDMGLLPWLLLRGADDAAYCAGVWWGCLSSGVLEPLLPAWGRSSPGGSSPGGTSGPGAATVARAVTRTARGIRPRGRIAAIRRR